MRLRLVGALAVAALLAGCATFTRPPMVLQPFASDGCSLFPDGTFKDSELWAECCLEHDLAYWRGGTEEERRAADAALRDCVLEKTGDKVLAEAMYHGVRAGGAAVYPSWYRWGYGWPYGRGTRPLSESERLRADVMLKEWRASQTPAPGKP